MDLERGTLFYGGRFVYRYLTVTLIMKNCPVMEVDRRPSVIGSKPSRKSNCLRVGMMNLELKCSFRIGRRFLPSENNISVVVRTAHS